MIVHSYYYSCHEDLYISYVLRHWYHLSAYPLSWNSHIPYLVSYRHLYYIPTKGASCLTDHDDLCLVLRTQAIPDLRYLNVTRYILAVNTVPQNCVDSTLTVRSEDLHVSCLVTQSNRIRYRMLCEALCVRTCVRTQTFTSQPRVRAHDVM